MLVLGGYGFFGTALDERYWAYARAWFWLGVLAFTSIIVVFWLMIAKPP